MFASRLSFYLLKWFLVIKDVRFDNSKLGMKKNQFETNIIYQGSNWNV